MFAAPPADAQAPRSGATVTALLAAINDGDEARLAALLDPTVTLVMFDEATIAGRAPVSATLVERLRPHEVVDARRLGRGGREADILVDGRPLRLTFRGAQGVIAGIVVIDQPAGGSNQSVLGERWYGLPVQSP